MTETARTVDGLAYEIAGSGPAVLLLHSGLTDRRMWDPLWDELAARFTAVRFDARGFGESTDLGESVSFHRDALAVLDDAGVDRAAVIGVSFGGSTAIDVALHAPARVRALVVVNAEPSGWEHSDELRQLQAEAGRALEAGDFDTANAVEMRIWLDGPARSPGEVDPSVRKLVSGQNRELLERQAAQDPEVDELDPAALARLGELSMPLLVVVGEFDQPSMRAACEALASATGAERAEIAGAAHLPMLERPREFAVAVLPFLEHHLR